MIGSELEAAAWWLREGFALLPCQPGSKALVKGYGPHQERISSAELAERWWRQGSQANIAVVAPADTFILDFDDAALFDDWRACPRSGFISTYAELTPRGGHHLFYRGRVLQGVRLRAGVELKTWCLVAPSRVGERSYRRGRGVIQSVDSVPLLSSLSLPGYPTPHLLRTMEFTEAARLRRVTEHEATRLDAIKSHFRIVALLKAEVPGFTPIGNGRFITARCPFHKDGREAHPSMWIDDGRGVWGCHACSAHGDVINLYALLHGISNREAIDALGALLP